MVKAKTILGVGEENTPRISLVGEESGSVVFVFTSITRAESLNTLSNELLTIKKGNLGIIRL